MSRPLVRFLLIACVVFPFASGPPAFGQDPPPSSEPVANDAEAKPAESATAAPASPAGSAG